MLLLVKSYKKCGTKKASLQKFPQTESASKLGIKSSFKLVRVESLVLNWGIYKKKPPSCNWSLLRLSSSKPLFDSIQFSIPQTKPSIVLVGFYRLSIENI